MKNQLNALLLGSICVLSTLIQSCDAPTTASAANTSILPASTLMTGTRVPVVKADAAAILAKTKVPILCYHQIRDYKPTDSKTARDYIVPVHIFQQQMQALADSGYTAILPEQLSDYLEYGNALPARPVMITFDDTRMDQYTAGVPALDKHGFKAAFFIMTVSLGRPGYMSAAEIKKLADAGHSIGSHTWDHHNVKLYKPEDWAVQIEKPSRQLEQITGQPVEYFAYPFGLWNKEAIVELKKRGFRSVYQLSAKRDEQDPMHSVRRIIVPGDWTANTMLHVMKKSF